MAQKNSYICTECKQSQSQWSGQCPGCKQWNSLEVVSIEKPPQKIKLPKSAEDFVLSEPRIRIGLGSCDNVFGNGLVKDSITLLAGEPGVGKSTILLQILKSIHLKNKDYSVLYVSGEESEKQIFKRAIRLKLKNAPFKILSTSIWQDIVEATKKEKPDLVVIDSIQTIRDDEISSQAGSSTQLRAVTSEAIEKFKYKNISTILVGHVTKEGSIAGPKHVEHMVDTVLTFTKNDSDIRILKAKKNRFGAVGEEAQFRMTEEGLVPISFEETFPKITMAEPGVTYSLVKNGLRNTLVEIQALVIENKYGQGRRVIQGVDVTSINTLLAVLEKELRLPLGNQDIYLKISMDSAPKNRNLEMAICCAVLSSYYNVALKNPIAWIGELRLGGNFKDHIPSLDEKDTLDKCKLICVSKGSVINSKKIEDVSSLSAYLRDISA